MEEQINQLPYWALPFLICLELVVLYGMSRVGQLVITCREALDWGKPQPSTSTFNAPSFLKGVTSISSGITPHVLFAFLAFIINGYCIVMIYYVNEIDVWVAYPAVYLNTAVIVNLFNVGGLIDKIVNTIIQVEQIKMESEFENIIEQFKERVEAEQEKEGK